MFTILYVDDEPALLEIAKLYLECNGQFNVDIVTTIPDALTLLSTSDYDAIISDYQMPKMDGIEFLKMVRSSGNTIPFILFTGKGREEIVIQALNEGADFYIQKGGEPRAQFAELAHKVRQSIQQRRAVISIRDLKRREADIINFLPDATFAIDTYGFVIAWNRAMEKMTGIRAAQILGKGNFEYALPFYRERRPVLIDLVLQNDPVTTGKYQNVIRDQNNLISEVTIPHFNNGKGASFWFIASQLYDTKGTVVGAIESIREITDRKRAEDELLRKNEELNAAFEELTTVEEELRQNYEEMSKGQLELRLSEERYRNVVEDQTEFICRFTVDGRLTFVNDAYCRYFGLDKNLCIGSHHTVVIPPEDLRLMKDHLSALSPENPVGILDHRIIMPSGEVRWQQWSDRATFDADGHVIEYQSVGRDTTERMEIEAKLKSMNEEMNASYEQLTATEEELRQNYNELNKSQQELRLSEERYRKIFHNSPVGMVLITPDYHYFSVNPAWIAMTGYSEKELMDLSFKDITHPNHLPGDLQYIQNLVEGKIPVYSTEKRYIRKDGSILWGLLRITTILDRQGTLLYFAAQIEDITERKLTGDALSKANKKLNLLSSITRHDINNQLLTLNAYSSLLKDQLPDPSSYEYFKKVTLAAQRINTMIQFSKEYEKIGITEPAWQNCHILVDSAKKHILLGDTLVKNDLPAAEEVFADPLIYKVFYNLIDNAVRHGGRVTTIRFSVGDRDGNRVIFCEDDGLGIPVDEKEKIFDQGFGRNTGMGLFLAREILDITAIMIRETGEQGRGARFEMVVPKEAFRLASAPQT